MGKPLLLVVDDEPTIRGALTRWFVVRGFEVHTAVDGQDAVEHCMSHEYDAITMDLEMPRMGGLDAIHAIRKIHARVPILVVSGLPRDAAEIIGAGATKIVMKPFKLKELEEGIQALMAQS